ncbi:MAG: NifB/NifX family molybdenum-iron cluster-binding protein [Actinomycetota bacterium]
MLNKTKKCLGKIEVAISTDGDFVSRHFGRCSEFTLLNIKNGKVIKVEVIKNPVHHLGFWPQFFKKKGVSCIIDSGMGTRAQELLNGAKINPVLGIEGKVQDAIDNLLAGIL